MHGPLQRQQGAIATHESVGVPVVPRRLGQATGRFPRRFAASLGDERKIKRVLLIHNRNQPVVQIVGAASAHPPLVLQHLLPAGADGRRQIAALEQSAVEPRQELLRSAHIQGIGHRHHAPRAGFQQCRRHGGKRVGGLVVDHRRLTGVQHHHRHGVFAQQLAQLLGVHRVLVPVVRLEQQSAVSRPQDIPAPRRRGISAIGPVSVEVENVVMVRMLPQVFAKLGKSGGPKNMDGNREGMIGRQFHQRPGDGSIFDIPLVRPGDDQQHVQAVIRQFDQNGRIALLFYSPFDFALMGQPGGRGILQRFPRPAQNERTVANHPHRQILKAAPCGVVVKIPRLSRTEQRVKRPPPPLPESRLNPAGILVVGMERIVEEFFQIPTKLMDEIIVGPPFHPDAVRRRDEDGIRSVPVAQPTDGKLRRISVRNMPDNQDRGGHDGKRVGCLGASHAMR